MFEIFMRPFGVYDLKLFKKTTKIATTASKGVLCAYRVESDAKKGNKSVKKRVEREMSWKK